MTPEEFRAFLDDISLCFTERNFDGWMARILLPFSMVTQQGPVLLSTRDALERNFELYLQAQETMQMDAIYRRPVSLENCHDGTWIGTYETELLSHGQRVTAPYTSSALIHGTDEGYKMSSILNARGHHPWTGTSPSIEGRLS